MKVALFGQFYHANSNIYIEELLFVLKRERIEVIIEKEFLKLIGKHQEINIDHNQFDTFTELDDSFDFFFTVGGDGTILQSVKYIGSRNIPVVGINTGRLGFLATVNKEYIEETILKLIREEYSISERSLLSIQTDPESEEISSNIYALNEVAVSRKNTTSMITIETWLDEEYLTAYWADGLIISTPTGSTGYSLSCGGPVITPSTKAFVITPIAPHNLNARPLIIKDSTKIYLKVSGREDNYLVSMDSRIATLPNNTSIIIQKAPFKIKMAEFHQDSFLQSLRKKLLWGEDKRN